MATAPTTADARTFDTTGARSLILEVGRAFGSLKLTVVLFSLSILIVLVGTLAQDQQNMQEVKERYFTSWIAWTLLDDFVPQAFWIHEEPIPGILPLPGGAMIGALLLINLVAAKVTRFKIHAKGTKLYAGIAMMLLGTAIAAGVVMLGHDDEGLQGTPPITYDALWNTLLGVATAGAAVLTLLAGSAESVRTKATLFGTAVLMVVAVAVLLATGYRIGDPGLRIVWQLSKGLIAGLVLMVGCQLLFAKQGGNVLLHLGVGLLMVGQFAFGDRQTELRLNLVEETATNAFVDLNQTELQFIATDDDGMDIIAVPEQRLTDAEANGQTIDEAALPVRVRVRRYYPNSRLVDLKPGAQNPATTGIGTEVAADEADTSGGASSAINSPAAYVELLDKETGRSLSTHLVTLAINDRQLLAAGSGAADIMDEVTVDGETYQLGLRLHREVKPYWVYLKDVQQINYSGTTTPRDYSSYLRIIETDTGDEFNERVWMNNPMRYRGETFYQSNYTDLPSGKQLTGIQVVRNSGWLIPYIACSISGLGMLVHFWGTLSRFVGRRRRETLRAGTTVEIAKSATGPYADLARSQVADPDRPTGAPPAGSPSRLPQWVVPILLGCLTLIVGLLLIPRDALMRTIRPASADQKFDLYAAGQIPVQAGGRIMPLDAYARQTLKAMTNKESLPLKEAPAAVSKRAQGRKLSAIEWLMEVATDEPTIDYLPMFRVDAPEVRNELELPRRETKLVTWEEIRKHIDRFSEKIDAARAKPQGEESFTEKKFLELNMRTQSFIAASMSFRIPRPENIPDEFYPEGTPQSAKDAFVIRRLQQRIEELRGLSGPAVIPPVTTAEVVSTGDLPWEKFSIAFFDSALQREKSPGVGTFAAIIEAYEAGDPAKFNAAVQSHHDLVSGDEVASYDDGKVWVESWLGAAGPTTIACGLYLLALILGLIHVATQADRLGKFVWGTVMIGFVVHTLVILARMYVTGRAPVINLYSSAVFIGWAAVLGGLVMERIYRYGTGTVLASAAGFLTLLLADRLTLDAGQQDTMPVLRAVLDTQFWLSTHVVSVALGYVATLVAGLLGIGYLIAGWSGASTTFRRDLYRCIYGASCFGILFSFIGTVLGGLWADDSWGRFWGWDPKENGALLIVIWNALMLHARWDGMVAGRGFAVLAIGGNIITAWSWFGTNELGIGLHSYGFTEGMLRNLAAFAILQMVFIIAGALIPPRDDKTVRLS